jgi:large subunit ribosomal protein L15
MNLHNLTKVTTPSAKRLGRGIGSGRGKTSGRGMKGQKARGKIPAANVGAGLIYFKKLPFKRGWGNSKKSVKPSLVTLEQLNVYTTGATVSIASLIENKIVTEKATRKGIKIVNGGQLTTKNITIEVPVTQSVKAVIEQAGGKVV